eukprot:CAMPEP_0184485308 /NCGR_PEP_ID=MMETSP0113_2-20130426/6927_1 /TAXON_ID=91329 /ORGANISM="Norrisiella sphaerica, Strain BC52" /LENGTH=222 /DNA_ID=CAMNT_0026866703 /DNA_START=214 /DNA_END=882 /DNA_ORIENTATION=+
MRAARSLRSIRNAPRSLAKPCSTTRTIPTKVQAGGYQQLSGMPGLVYDQRIFLQKDGWDPFRFAEEADETLLNRYRDSELVHGRTAMLAILGQLVAERYHPFMPEATGTAWEQFVAVNEKYPAFGLGFLLHVATQEIFRNSQYFDGDIRKGLIGEFDLKDGVEPGTYGFDPLGLMPKDPEAAQKRKSQEINNGRLAMVASLGLLAEEGKFGSPIVDKIIPIQ